MEDARQLRGVLDIFQEDTDHEDMIVNAGKELEKPTAPVMSCVARRETILLPIVRETTPCSLREVTPRVRKSLPA